MCGSMVDIQSAAAEIRRGIKKKIEDRKKPHGKNIMSVSATQGGHKKSIQETKNNKKASIRWLDSARRQFQAGLKGDVGL